MTEWKGFKIVDMRVRPHAAVSEGVKTMVYIVEAFVVEEGSAGCWLAFANRDGAISRTSSKEAVSFERLMRSRYGLPVPQMEDAA
ncbi:hypothetical protein [Methylocystis sp. S23]|jgi:hypothetical protein